MKFITIMMLFFAITFAGLTAASSSAMALTKSGSFTIKNDPGGVVVDYAISMLKLQRSHLPVIFSGRCDSACTMYLGLDKAQTCIRPSARFGFHLPFGSSNRGNVEAAKFLMRKYPRWVHTWIKANGGLSSQLKVMSYSYASQFLKPCNSLTRPL